MAHNRGCTGLHHPNRLLLRRLQDQPLQRNTHHGFHHPVGFLVDGRLPTILRAPQLPPSTHKYRTIIPSADLHNQSCHQGRPPTIIHFHLTLKKDMNKRGRALGGLRGRQPSWGTYHAASPSSRDHEVALPASSQPLRALETR